MRELAQIYTDPQHLIDVALEQLAAKILFVLHKRQPVGLAGRHSTLKPHLLSNEINALWPNNGQPPPPWTTLTVRQREDVDLAIAEARASLFCPVLAHTGRMQGPVIRE